jgi:NAD+ synthase (glutamine-hydrolysing)
MLNTRVRLVQMEVLPGRPADNTCRMLAALESARADGIQVVAFPEMAIPGYLLGDEWERPAFLRDCEAWGERVREASRDLIVLFGNVGVDWHKRQEDGRVRKYNALFVAQDGRFIGPEGGPYPFAIKTLMPNYREFDDSRHFYDMRKLAFELGRDVREFLAPVPTRLGRIGAVLCEDAWDGDYSLSPLRVMAGKNVDFFVNASCSPFTLNKNPKRNRVFAAAAKALRTPLFYVNNIGLQNNGKTVFTFDGACCVYDGHGGQVTGPAAFEEGVLDVTLPGDRAAAFGRVVPAKNDDCAMLANALLFGMDRFMRLCGVSRVVVGASGGIDSALVAALYARLLPPENLLLVNMPSRYNSKTTISLARTLAANLGCGYAEVPIEDSVNVTRGQIDGLAVAWPGGVERRLALSDLLLENVQARDRTARVLAAVGAAFGGVFTCNANKSEMTVGYTTLYGDLGGYLAAIADLWKGEVYSVARHMNESVFRRAVIPEGSFKVVPSAELSTAQAVDEGKGDPLIYPYHDCLFRSWVEEWNRTTPEEMLEWYLAGTLETRVGYAGRVKDLFASPAAFIADLERWWGLYQGLGVAKRIQAPPVLAVKRRAFGFDHREAQMGARYTERYLALRAEALRGPP